MASKAHALDEQILNEVSDRVTLLRSLPPHEAQGFEVQTEFSGEADLRRYLEDLRDAGFLGFKARGLRTARAMWARLRRPEPINPWPWTDPSRDGDHTTELIAQQQIMDVLAAMGAPPAERKTASPLPPLTGTKPLWNKAAKKLWLGEQLVKQFKNSAGNQFAILDSFQDSGWPEHVEAPSGKDKLKQTLRDLNRGQLGPRSISFRKNGLKQIYWVAKKTDRSGVKSPSPALRTP